MLNESIIVFGFPGTGKSYACKLEEELDLKLQDSDSSHFHWMYEKDDFKDPIFDEKGNKIPHPEWPMNYAKYIEITGREIDNNPDYIFVSTHEEVMETIGRLGFRTFTVVPWPDDKDHYLRLYAARGSSQEFIDNLDVNWKKFIDGTIARASKIGSTVIYVRANGNNKNITDLLKNNAFKNIIDPLEFDN